MTNYLRDAGRWVEIPVGLFTLVASAFAFLFGVIGFIDFTHGSHAAGADPLWCSVEIASGLLLGFYGVRMALGSSAGAALLSNTMLLVCGLALVGGAGFLVWDGNKLEKGMIARGVASALTLGISALVLWRRVRGDAA